MDQKLENAITPAIVDHVMLSMKSDNTANAAPSKANTHQHSLPKWYSAFITIGWKMPIIRNVTRPVIIPEILIMIVPL